MRSSSNGYSGINDRFFCIPFRSRHRLKENIIEHLGGDAGLLYSVRRKGTLHDVMILLPEGGRKRIGKFWLDESGMLSFEGKHPEGKYEFSYFDFCGYYVPPSGDI